MSKQLSVDKFEQNKVIKTGTVKVIRPEMPEEPQKPITTTNNNELKNMVSPQKKIIRRYLKQNDSTGQLSPMNNDYYKTLDSHNNEPIYSERNNLKSVVTPTRFDDITLQNKKAPEE